jgi:predicted alpha/beta superfamily hydrolase
MTLRTETHEIASRALDVAGRRLTVLLPGTSRVRTRGLPVLYLNDGQNLFDPARAFAGNTWRAAETIEWLIRRSRIPRLLVVGIDHGGSRRAREYLPADDDRNPDARGALGDDYAAFVTREVMPFVARTYGVAQGASATGFGGSSYGGVAALHTALRYPGTFGRLLIESPSLYVGRELMLRRARAARRWPSRVYLGVGTAETGDAAWNEETVRNVRTLARTLRRAGLGPRRLKVVVEDGATHSEGAWAARLPSALEFLFG